MTTFAFSYVSYFLYGVLGQLFDLRKDDILMSYLQSLRSVKEVLSANSEATEEHIEKQDKVLNSLGIYLALKTLDFFREKSAKAAYKLLSFIIFFLFKYIIL